MIRKRGSRLSIKVITSGFVNRKTAEIRNQPGGSAELMIKTDFMKRLVVICSLLWWSIGAFAQTSSKPLSKQTDASSHQEAAKPTIDADGHDHRESGAHEGEADGLDIGKHVHNEMVVSVDSLSMSDYSLSIERVNDFLIAIEDSAKLGFNVVETSRRISAMSKDILLLRENIRNRTIVFNVKNQYLYECYTEKLETETDQIQAKLDILYKRLYDAKLLLNKAMSDSVFQKLYANSKIRTTFDEKLIRLDKKWHRTDSTTRANSDTLNNMKMKLSDNSYNLSNMLSMLAKRMDRSIPIILGTEVNNIWGTEFVTPQSTRSSTGKVITILESEQSAVSYYFNQTDENRNILLVVGLLLFFWLYMKRKLLKKLKDHPDSYSFLKIQYLANYPVLSLFVLLLSVLPFLDAHAPTLYVSTGYLILLVVTTVIFIKKRDRAFQMQWLVLVALFIAEMLAYLLIQPTFFERMLLLVLNAAMLFFTYRFFKSLSKQTPHFKSVRIAVGLGVFLSGLAILLNIFGRFTLSRMAGLAGIFAVAQAIVLTIFIEVIIEIVLLQLQSSRHSKGIDKPFDIKVVIGKVQLPFLIVAVVLWLIMLLSNLSLYHNILHGIQDALTRTRTIGSISFQLLSVILFFAIIWFAHILQRLISFFFGETGTESDDSTTIIKGQHSRLLITRLFVLIGGYFLAIAASGLPIDKLTFLLGALGVGIGMGLQSVVNNFVSGIILIFDGSLQIGDEVEVSGQSGKVKEIGLRASTLYTADGAEVTIPNGNILSQNIVNWTFSNNEKRVMLRFSLSAKELDANVINEVINGTIKKIPNVISSRNPVILYTRVTTETCTLAIRFWCTINNADWVKSEAMQQLSAAFALKKIGFK